MRHFKMREVRFNPLGDSHRGKSPIPEINLPSLAPLEEKEYERQKRNNPNSGDRSQKDPGVK